MKVYELGLRHITLRNDMKKDLEKLEIIKERLKMGNYISDYAKSQERRFVDELEAKITIAKWVDEHYDSMVVENDTRRSIKIRLPKWDGKAKRFSCFDSELVISDHGEGDWIRALNRVFECRLDWTPILFADILRNQDCMDEWCEELHNSYRERGVYGY